MQFLAAAKNLAAGHGLRRVEGTPFVEWAPLVPARLALARDPMLVARLMGVISAAGIVWAAGLWAWRRTRSRWTAVFAGIGIAVSFPLTFVASHLWSDGPFLFFSLVGVLALGSAHKSDRRRAVALAAIPAALAALTRYVGVTLIAAGVVSICLDRPRPDRLQRAVLYGWLASLPLVLWLVRNVMVTGTATGDREPPGFSVAANSLALAHATAGDLLPWHWPGAIKVGLVAAGLVAGWLLVRRSRAEKAGPLGLFALFYGLAVVIVASIWGSDRVDVRLALPVYVALVAGACAAAVRVRWWVIVAALALVWLVQSASVTLRHVSLYAARGVPGFSDAHWRASETLRLLRTQPPNGRIYSNAPEIAYVALGREVRRSPRAHLFYAKGVAVPDLEEFRRELTSGPATLVWFDSAGEDRFVTPANLGVTLQQTARTTDGALYAVSSR